MKQLENLTSLTLKKECQKQGTDFNTSVISFVLWFSLPAVSRCGFTVKPTSRLNIQCKCLYCQLIKTVIKPYIKRLEERQKIKGSV